MASAGEKATLGCDQLRGWPLPGVLSPERSATSPPLQARLRGDDQRRGDRAHSRARSLFRAVGADRQGRAGARGLVPQRGDDARIPGCITSTGAATPFSTFVTGAKPTQMWEIAYNNYASRDGIALPQTLQVVDKVRPTSVDHDMDLGDAHSRRGGERRDSVAGSRSRVWGSVDTPAVRLTWQASTRRPSTWFGQSRSRICRCLRCSTVDRVPKVAGEGWITPARRRARCVPAL